MLREFRFSARGRSLVCRACIPAATVAAKPLAGETGRAVALHGITVEMRVMRKAAEPLTDKRSGGDAVGRQKNVASACRNAFRQ